MLKCSALTFLYLVTAFTLRSATGTQTCWCCDQIYEFYLFCTSKKYFVSDYFLIYMIRSNCVAQYRNYSTCNAWKILILKNCWGKLDKTYNKIYYCHFVWLFLTKNSQNYLFIKALMLILNLAQTSYCINLRQW